MGFSSSKCKNATKRYRSVLTHINQLNIDAPEACRRLKEAVPKKYKDCMASLAQSKKSAQANRKVVRLQMQRHCKRSVAARLSGTKFAPAHFTEDSLLGIPINEMLLLLEEYDFPTRIAVSISQKARNNGKQVYNSKSYSCGKGFRSWSERTQLRKDACLERARWKALIKAKDVLEKGIRRCKVMKSMEEKNKCREIVRNDIAKLNKEINFSKEKAKQIEKELKGGI